MSSKSARRREAAEKRARASRRSRKPAISLLVVATMAATWLLVSGESDKVTEEIDEPTIEATNLPVWYMDRVDPPRPESGQMPNISHLDWPTVPYTAPDSYAEVPQELRPLIDRRIKAILGSGLIPELQEIREAMETSQIRVTPSHVPGAAGMFMAMKESGEWVPYLVVSPYTISTAETPSEILYIALMFAHEWRHKWQWESLGKPELANFVDGPKRKFTDEECSTIWHAEADAYFRQCHQMYRWGMEGNLGDMCHSMGLGSTYEEAHIAFNYFLWRDAMPRHLQNHPECVWRVATEAGHPEADNLPR